MAAPALRSSSYTAGTGSGTITVTKPSGAVDGDLLLAFGHDYWNDETGSPPTAMAPPAGWSTIYSVKNFGAGQYGARAYVFQKVASGEGASFAFTGGGPVAGGVQVIAVSGASGLVEASSVAETASAATADATSVTTLGSDRLLVAVYWLDLGFTNISITLPAGFTAVSAVVGAHRAGVAEQAVAGASGAKTATGNGVGRWQAVLLAIPSAAQAPAARPGVTTTQHAVRIGSGMCV